MKRSERRQTKPDGVNPATASGFHSIRNGRGLRIRKAKRRRPRSLHCQSCWPGIQVGHSATHHDVTITELASSLLRKANRGSIRERAMSIDLRKRLIYVISICSMMGLLVALWATEGFKDFSAWESKPVMPFVWGIPVFAAALGPLLLTNKLSAGLQTRSGLELWGRGSICGLMVAVGWACIFFADVVLKEVQLHSEIYVVAIGLVAALGLGAIGVLSDGFLRGNLVAIGWLTAVAGSFVFGGSHRPIGQWIVSAGVSLVLTVTLSTGRVMLYRRRGGSREISRDDDPVEFWIIVIVLAALDALIIFSAARDALGW